MGKRKLEEVVSPEVGGALGVDVLPEEIPADVPAAAETPVSSVVLRDGEEFVRVVEGGVETLVRL